MEVRWMHNRLNNLQKKYKEEIPTTFTENDRQSIIQSIKRKEHDKTTQKSLFPRLLSVMMLSLALVVGAYFLADEFNLGGLGSSSGSWNKEKAEENIRDIFQDGYFSDYDFPTRRQEQIKSMKY